MPERIRADLDPSTVYVEMNEVSFAVPFVKAFKSLVGLSRVGIVENLHDQSIDSDRTEDESTSLRLNAMTRDRLAYISLKFYKQGQSRAVELLMPMGHIWQDVCVDPESQHVSQFGPIFLVDPDYYDEMNYGLFIDSEFIHDMQMLTKSAAIILNDSQSSIPE